MATIIPLAPYLAREQVAQALRGLMGASVGCAPAPEDHGWTAVGWDEEGRPVRWMDFRSRAVIGYVPGDPELVFLDYRHEMRAWSMEIGELVASLETGTLPDPEYALDWDGNPIP